MKYQVQRIERTKYAVRNSVFLLLCALSSVLSYSQTPGQWTWMSGGQTASSPVKGTKGVPSVNNHPGSLYEAVNWTDAQGNFWIYGGADLSGGTNYDDLWKYNPSTNEWTWVFGTSTSGAVPNFGTKGIPSVFNTPGNRGYGTIGWVDQSGNLWLFGGWCWGMSGQMNDVWKYDFSTGFWTWMSGTNIVGDNGTYGTKGVPSVNNCPEARLEGPCYWQDANYNFWIFGGEGSAISKLEDIWRFNPSTLEWTWMKGNHSITTAVYGTKGVSNAANTPGGRQCYTHWMDKAGKFWIFGGTDYSGGDFGDLWKYDPVTNNWTWMSGSSAKGNLGSYPSYCVNDTNAFPGAIYENKVCWTDQCGNFWMFGGFSRNDLWQYNPTTNKWKFISGSSAQNASGSYGVQGVSSATNLPPARGGGSASLDLNGNLWMFGGYSNGSGYTYGDLWRYVPDTACIGGCGVQSLPAAHFVSSDTAFCSEGGECIDFTDHSTGSPLSWKWLFPGAVPDTSTIQNPTGICYSTPGTYAVTLIVSNSGGSDTLKVSPLITFGSGAAVPFLYQSGDTLFCSHDSAYQWYFNGSPILGATDSFYVALNPGTYNAYITDSIGCSRLGNGILFLGINDLNEQGGIQIYPNPAGDEFTVSGLPFSAGTSIEVYDVPGHRVYSGILNNKLEIVNPPKDGSAVVDCKLFSSGMYLVKVTSGERVFYTKFIKE